MGQSREENVYAHAPTVKHFTRILWREPKYRDLWAPRLQRISAMVHAAEYKTVAEGYRRAATYHVTLENFPEFIKKLQEDGLYFVPIARSAFYEGFSHYHVPPKPGQPYFWYGAVVRDLKDGLVFKKASGSRDGHKVIGELLGYPPCCVDFFTSVWNKGIFDPLWEAAKSDTDPVLERNPWLGVYDKEVIYIPDPYVAAIQELRYFGIRLTTHIPHSHRCNATRKLGKVWGRVMESIDPEAYEWLIQILSSPIVWDSYHGVVQVHTEFFVGITHTYPYFRRRRLIVLNEERIPWDIYL